MRDERELLPLEKLKKKYIPVVEFPRRYNISVDTILDLVNNHNLRYAEFRVPGETRRSMHVNYEEVLTMLGKEI